ncbi:hypothetical protein DSM112329_03844 [Paraconexibacter sp. AEG42_29]|uniref:RNA polymerase sigma-70 region 2 domain-containing protein n=2 Tax=Paraconexibacter sp. AEG42_29 TaxID=2997339 RepID=A0AAU7AZB8_9ACTN
MGILQRHADTLLRVARRHSSCDDDAADACQRGLEILIRNAGRLDPATADRWLFRVVRNEALALREQRARSVGQIELAVDQVEARHLPSPEEQAITREGIAQTREALTRLKADELRALCLKAAGRSYAEIATGEGWSHTKVNRALVEGRRRIATHREELESGRECARWASTIRALGTGDVSAADLTAVRGHLRHCGACQGAVRRLHRPMEPGSAPAVVAAGAGAGAAQRL